MHTILTSQSPLYQALFVKVDKRLFFVLKILFLWLFLLSLYASRTACHAKWNVRGHATVENCYLRAGPF